jgi:hypothetical protein
MPSVGLLIFLVIGIGALCVRQRAAGAAAVCAGLAVLFVVSTPVGSGLPGVVASVFSAVDNAATPALNHDTSTSTGPASTGATTVGVKAGGRR